MTTRNEHILILCKTYPSPSAKHAETSCVAGITEKGELLRLYPVPFRLIGNDQQFRKWQWIDARIRRATDDRRKESHRIYVDTIELGDVIPTAHDWQQRRLWLEKLPLFEDFNKLEQTRRKNDGPTLALLHPGRLIGLDIGSAGSPDWSAEEKAKLLKLQTQGNLFKEADSDLRLLRKLPFDFHYRYECATPDGIKNYRHKIVDWEIGALYWNVRRKHGSAWEAPFRTKIEIDLAGRELLFLMGTIHRFPDQWLIVSLLYPPRQQLDAPNQGSLFAP